MRNLSLYGLLLMGLLLVGCRGTESANPPIHINPSMDDQERLDPQAAFAFFEDGRAMRPPVPGTIARGFLKTDVAFHNGRTAEGGFVTTNPMPTTRALLERGQQRYDIYCAPCHGKAGDGQGPIIVGDYGYVPAPTYHQDRLRDAEDGYLYEVIANGIRNMPGYAAQVPVADRWAITAYIRALQRSQDADAGDVPESVQAAIDQGSSANMGVQ